MKGILGTKIGMTQVWQDDKLVPVTVVLAGPCPVVQRRTAITDGYSAVQLAWEDKKRVNKPMSGHFSKAGVDPKRHLAEFRDYEPEEDEVTVTIFEAGQKVDVSGVSKGRGTSGVMRRWNFSGLPASHGVKKKHRSPGSIASGKSLGRINKGKKMAGRYGGKKATTLALNIVEIRPDDNLLLIKGALPGPNGGLLVIKDSKRNR